MKITYFSCGTGLDLPSVYKDNRGPSQKLSNINISISISMLLEAYGLRSAKEDWQTPTSSQLAQILLRQHLSK